MIDPVLTYSTYFGGSGDEACPSTARLLIAGISSPPSGCPAVAIDASSNIYLAGSTSSANLPVVPPVSTPPSAFQPALAVAPDAFVTKLNAAGSAVLFSTYLGGDGVDTTAGVAVDSAFNVVVAGTTASSNFPVSTASAFQAHPLSPGTHAFASELDPTGEDSPVLHLSFGYRNGIRSRTGTGPQKQDLRHRHHHLQGPARRHSLVSCYAGRDPGGFAG